MIGARSSKSYPLCPVGPQQLVCVDIVSLGVKPGPFGDKPKVRLVFQSALVDPDTGKRYQVSSQFTESLHEKSALGKFVESWFGRKLSNDERETGLPDEAFVGTNGFASVVHSDDGKYANIQSIMPPPRGTTELQPIGYIRAKDRQQQTAAEAKASDDVPF